MPMTHSYLVDINRANTFTFDQTIEFAAGTDNANFLVSNTSNTAIAAHAIIEAKVGGTTSVGDPQYRWTIPSGTSWYAGVDNSSRDTWILGTGTTVGTNPILEVRGSIEGSVTLSAINIRPLDLTTAAGSGADYRALTITAYTHTLADTTQITSLGSTFNIGIRTIAQAGATTVDKSTGAVVTGPTPGANVTLTEGSAIRILDTSAPGGTLTRQAGLIIEALTRGTTNPQILLYNGSTEHTSAVADTGSISVVDVGTETVFSLTQETGLVTTGDAVANRKFILRVNGTTIALLGTTTLTAE